MSFEAIAPLASSRILVSSSFCFGSILSPCSCKVRLIWSTKDSALFFTSTSPLRFSSSALCSSASLTMRSMSALERPLLFWIVMSAVFWVSRSFAETLTMPLTSIENLTSMRGVPRGAGRMPESLEVAEQFVVVGHRALALVDDDVDRRLVVFRGGEDLRFLGRDRRVAGDERGHDAAEGLDAEGERGDVEQDHVLDVAGDDGALDGGAGGDGLVRVDGEVDFLARDGFDHLLDGRHAGRAADHQDLVDFRILEAGVGHRLL